MFLQKRLIFTFLVLLTEILSNTAFSQSSLIQLSGIVSDEQNLSPIPYAQVQVPANKHFTYASLEGFFSLVVTSGDTIRFSALGYAPKNYVIPDSGYNTIASIAVFLSKDTITLESVEIYPWPDKEEFRKAFLAYEEKKENQITSIPGIRGKEDIDTVPAAPTLIKNPISFIYDEVVKPIQWQQRKRKMVGKLPQWEDN